MAALPHGPGENSWLRPDLAYSELPATPARVLRLLVVHPGPDVSIAAAAALADVSIADANDVLERLTRARLVETTSGSEARWWLRSPARRYVQGLVDALCDADEREQARDRLLDYYLLTAEAADDWLRGLPAVPVPGEFTDRNGALSWLDTERLCLVNMVRRAADTGREHVAMNLPLLMAQYLGFRGRFDELIAVTSIGLDAARDLSDRAAEGEALTNLGLARSGARQFPEAIRAHQDAVAIFRETGDRQGQGAARNNLGLALHGLNRNDEAVRAHQGAAAIFREVGCDNEQANALANMGNALNEIGLSEQARTAYQKAADAFHETGDLRGELMARRSLQLTREMS